MDVKKGVTIALGVLIVLQAVTLAVMVAGLAKLSAIETAVGWMEQSVAATCKAVSRDVCP